MKNNTEKILGKFLIKGNSLDIGAGTGDFLLTAKKNGWETIGFEPNAKAKESAQKKGINFAEVTLHIGLGTFNPVEVED